MTIGDRLRQIADLQSGATIVWSPTRCEPLADRLRYWASEIDAGRFGVPGTPSTPDHAEPDTPGGKAGA